MRIGIVHSSLNPAGGAERVCVAAVDALKQAGYWVVLASLEPTNWEKVESLVGPCVRPDEEISVLGRELHIFDIYKRLLVCLLVPRLRRLCDLVINTHGDILLVNADMIYMHYPTFLTEDTDPVNEKYTKSLFWRLYHAPYQLVRRLLTARYPRRSLILTNSRFSQREILKLTGQKSVVVYPPVETSRFSSISVKRERQHTVLTCGRYAPEKNYELVLEVAKKLDEAIGFVIIGSVVGRLSERYYDQLLRMKQEWGTQNVNLLRDVPFKKLSEHYANAKIYLHTMVNEHFGIAVVEAMAAGLIPVIHRSGGAWEDILQETQGSHGFSYATVDEAVKIVEQIIVGKHSEGIVERNREYIERFSGTRFKIQIAEIVERLCNIRCDY